MVDKTTRLTEIYKSEKGQGGGLGSTLGKAFLEKIDPRKMFNQGGLMAAMLPSLFKAYSATGTTSTKGAKGISSGSSVDALSSFSSAAVESKLDDIYISNKIIAKNSMTLPMMSRDMNVMRQNVVKLVKLQRGNAATKADMFFQRAGERESAYENQFKKERAVGSSNLGGNTSSSGGLLSGLGKAFSGIGSGIQIASIGAGIGGFFAGVAAGGWAVNKLGGASGVKDILVALGTGLKSFDVQGLTAMGAMLAPGMIFGAISGPVGAAVGGSGSAVGMTMIGTGIGGFFLGLSAGAKVAQEIGGPSSVKEMMTSLAEGLNAFNTQSLTALGSMLAVGGLFGAIAGPASAATLGGGAALGMTLIGAGIGGFFLALSAGARVAQELGGPQAIKLLLLSLAEGMEPFTKMNGTNLLNVGTGIAALSAGLVGLFAGQGIQALQDGYKWLKGLVFSNDKQQKGFFETLADQLKILEKVDSTKIKDVGDGFKNIVDGVDKLRGISNDEIADVGRKLATIAEQARAITQLQYTTAGMTPAPVGNGNFIKTSVQSSTQNRSPTTTSNLVTPGSGASGTFNGMSQEEQLKFLQNQFRAEGNKPGNLAYDLNNPSAMLYSPWQKQFGGEPDITGRGTIYDKNGKKVPFAKFPTLEQGFEAQRYLWQRDYGNRPMGEAIARWSGTTQGSAEHKTYVATATGNNNNAGSTISAGSTQVADAHRVAPVVISGNQINSNNSESNGKNQPAPAPLVQADVMDGDLMKELFRKRVVNYA